MVTASDSLHDEVERKLRAAYLYGPKDPTRRMLDKLLSVIAQFRESDLKLTKLLQDVADTVNRQFWLKEVTIGLKDSDGKYRYKIMCGLRPDAWKAHQELAYTLEEFTDPRYYKGRQLSKYTKLFLAEDKPFVDGEEDTFTRPILLKARRRSVEDCIEGDYLDTHIFSRTGELIGWLEISGTKDGKFPDPVTIRWIEVLALIIGTALQYEREGKGGGEGRLRSLANIARGR
ncbi:TPA: hypothetical protein HA259_01100 [Thermoplasmata archaeon]|nr:hypothetical protein [Thermoplasmata archaeon]